MALTLATSLVSKENQMNEIEINAKFAALIAQRNDAQNVAVNLAGSLAVAQERIKELENQISKLETAKQDTVCVGAD